MSDDSAPSISSSERHANAVVPLTKYDFCGFFLGCVGFCLLMAVVRMENCPVRVGHNEPYLSYPDRRYYYFGLSDNKDQLVTWSYLESLACEKYERAEQTFGGPLATIGTTLLSQVPMVGEVLPCEGRSDCRASLGNRCSMYAQPPMWKLIKTICNTIAMICVLCGGTVLMMCKKKKYRVYVVMWYSVGALTPYLANFICEQNWDMLFNSMQSLAPYPFGDSQSSFQYCYGLLSNLGYILLGLSYLCSCCGVLPEPTDSDKSNSDND